MSFISKIFGKKELDSPLFGTWFSDFNDEKTKAGFGNVKMTFTKDGKLIYEIREGDKRQIITMIYSFEGNSIITDQPSHPRIEKTEYLIINENALILKLNGEEGCFIKDK